MPVKSNKWSQYDEPEYRTGGMKRVGYDADTQQYTYRDVDGSLWQSAPGAEYGELKQVSNGRSSVSSEASLARDDSSTAKKAASEYKPEYSHFTIDTSTDDSGDNKSNRKEVAKGPLENARFSFHDLEATQGEDVRGSSNENKVTDYPTSKETYRALLPFFLVVCAFLLLVIRLFHPGTLVRPSAPPCPQHSRSYEIKSGDTCWAVAKDYGATVDSLRSFNPFMECSTLQVGQYICVPVKD